VPLRSSAAIVERFAIAGNGDLVSDRRATGRGHG
jgi:hypothetical protein